MGTPLRRSAPTERQAGTNAGSSHVYWYLGGMVFVVHFSLLAPGRFRIELEPIKSNESRN
jgi:hypothetical protein